MERELEKGRGGGSVVLGGGGVEEKVVNGWNAIYDLLETNEWEEEEVARAARAVMESHSRLSIASREKEGVGEAMEKVVVEKMLGGGLWVEGVVERMGCGVWARFLGGEIGVWMLVSAMGGVWGRVVDRGLEESPWLADYMITSDERTHERSECVSELE